MSRVDPITFTVHPFGKGSLTSGSDQYSSAYTTSTDAYEAVETKTITLPRYEGYTLEELAFVLIGRNKSSSTSEAVNFKWQISDDGSNWEDLIAEQTHSADASAYEEETWSGYFAPTGNFKGNGRSFQIRYVIKSGSAGGETATGQTNSDSAITLKLRNWGK